MTNEKTRIQTILLPFS